MLLGRLWFSVLVFALAGSATGAAHAQVSAAPAVAPAPASAPLAAAPVGVPQPASTPAAAITAPATSGPDPATVQRAIEAKAAGQLIDVDNPATVIGCRDLGEDAADSSLDGIRGRARLRVELRNTAQSRGASHIRYSEYSAGLFQSEHARFYDCTGKATATAPPVGVGTGLAPPKGALGVQLELISVGTLKIKVDQASDENDVSTTLGVSGAAEYFVSPHFAVGAVPGLVFGLKGSGASSSATQLDLRLRGRFGQIVSDGLAVHGYVTVGGSWIFLPGDSEQTSSGATLGLGLGVSYPLRGAKFINFDLGYQLGYQSVSINNTDIDVSSSFLHIGFGVGAYL